MYCGSKLLRLFAHVQEVGRYGEIPLLICHLVSSSKLLNEFIRSLVFGVEENLLVHIASVSPLLTSNFKSFH
jgi:hypothetical protein